MAEQVVSIPLEKLHPFPNHPFESRDDDAMRETVESVKQYGVICPAIVRPPESGDYEIIAGLEAMPAIVRELDDDTATILWNQLLLNGTIPTCRRSTRRPAGEWKICCRS